MLRSAFTSVGRKAAATACPRNYPALLGSTACWRLSGAHSWSIPAGPTGHYRSARARAAGGRDGYEPESSSLEDSACTRPTLPHVPKWTGALGLGGFLAVCFDIFAPGSLHLLAPIDAFGHATSLTLNPFSREVLGDLILSDFFIVAGVLGWVACSTAIVLDGVRPGPDGNPYATRSLLPLSLAWLSFFYVAGPVNRDPLIVQSIKTFFHRFRPSEYHSSFSFPSGHTSSALFLTLTLLFVLLPLAANTRLGKNWKPLRALTELQGAWPIGVAAYATTAVGRIMADAHWTSDTIAASFLSLVLLSAMATSAQLALNLPIALPGTSLPGPAADAAEGEERLAAVKVEKELVEEKARV